MDADKWTDAELKRLEARIAKEYKQASEELQEKAIRYFNGYDEDVNGKIIHHKGYYERKAEEYKAMQKGVYSQDDYNAWMYAQLGRGEHWEKLRDQMSDRLNDANKIAQDYANGILPKVYTTNYNYVAKIAQDSAMEQGIMGIKFDLVDEYTVKRLMEQSSEVRPYKPIEISLDKNTRYNKTKLQNALLQGILQGESVQKIATRFAKATNMQRACAIRNARTAVTGARNAGKQDRYADLASKGCQTFKKWKATADERTRTEHMQAWSDYGTDDKAIPYDEPFEVGGEELMYPADRVGSPWNIYNCRCTMASVFKFKSTLSDKKQKSANIQEATELNRAQAELKDLLKKQKTKENALNKLNYTLSGIWKDDVDLSDWESKQSSIPLNKAYFEDEKIKAIAINDTAKIAELDAKLQQLEDFDKNGKKWYTNNNQLKKIKNDIKSKQNHINILNGYNPAQDKYSQHRKDNALWAKNTKEADKVLRGVCGDVWKNAKSEERRAIYDYTWTYSPYNEVLRGIQYGLGGTASGFKGVGNVDLNGGGRGKDINRMTELISRSTYTEDIWLQRGCRYSGMDKFLGIDDNLLRNGTTSELENALLGKEVTEYGFMSCGVAKGKGFSGNIILNIYAPAGTEMMYAEPFSKYGNGGGLSWDGIKGQSSFGSESEIILNQGYNFEVTKIERKNGTIYIDLDALGRRDAQVWQP